MIWGWGVFFTEVRNYRKIYTAVSITDYTGSINWKIRAQEEDCSKWENIAKGTTLLVRSVPLQSRQVRA